MSRKVRILDVVYNASNNELVRTQTLVKNAIIQVDAAPFKAWYQTHYGVELGGKGKETEVNKLEERKVGQPNLGLPRWEQGQAGSGGQQAEGTAQVVSRVERVVGWAPE